MVAADTNVLVRLIVRDNAEQVAAATGFLAKGVWVSGVVLAETMWVLAATYKKSTREIAEAVETILDHKDVTVENSEAVEAALGLFRKRPGLRFSDCLILELARKEGHLPLGTFDRELGKVTGAERL
jgi:predicted nucleic-acid-binding protein